MSLRLRILLLISAVNVAVLLLVVYLGHRLAEDVAPVGTSAFVQAVNAANAENPEEQPWGRLRFLLRLRADDRTCERIAPAGIEAELEEVEANLLEAVQRGETGIHLFSGGMMVVHPAGATPWLGYSVGFRDRANPEALQTLRSIYILLCAGTLLLTLGIYLVLSRLVLRPLEELARASQEVADGQPPQPVRRPRGHDEIAHLVDNFNHMSREVYEYQQHLEERVLVALRRVTAAESRLVVAQRLAATGTLAAGFAHEINNPLGGILNALRRLREGELKPERREEYFDLVLDGLDRIRTIVDRILHFTPSTREPAEIVVADVCERAVALASHRAEKQGAELVLEPGEAVEGVVGDAQELTQALLNLILNAVDAVPEGGRVTVRTRPGRGSAVVIEVEDNGEGMDEETRRRCVDFFFSTKPEGEGTGLGLAIVQHIVTDHGGSLDIESERGRGTVVRIGLPRSEQG